MNPIAIYSYIIIIIMVVMVRRTKRTRCDVFFFFSFYCHFRLYSLRVHCAVVDMCVCALRLNDSTALTWCDVSNSLTCVRSERKVVFSFNIFFSSILLIIIMIMIAMINDPMTMARKKFPRTIQWTNLSPFTLAVSSIVRPRSFPPPLSFLSLSRS